MIKCKEKNKYTVYIPNYYYDFDEKTIYEFIEKIINKLKKIYNIDLYSKFIIDCYKCKQYGIILEIKKEYDPFLSYCKKKEINLNVIDSIILFEIDDYYFNKKIQLINNKLYIDPDSNINIELVKDIIYIKKYNNTTINE